MGVKIKKGDMVEVIAGNEKASKKRGTVLKVTPENSRVIVEGVNMVKRHMKPSQTSQGGIVEKEAGIQISNVGVVCDSCDRPVKIAMKILEDGTKVRACRRCGEVFDK